MEAIWAFKSVLWCSWEMILEDIIWQEESVQVQMNGSYFLWCCNVFTTSTFLRMYYLHFQKCVHPGDSSAHRLKRGANLPSSSLISPYHLNQFATQRRLQVGSLNLLVISNSALGNHVRWQETCRKEKDIYSYSSLQWFCGSVTYGTHDLTHLLKRS